MFDNVRLSGSPFGAGYEFAIDNVAVSPASVVPEPATVTLVAVGLALVSASRAFRRWPAAPERRAP